MAATIDEGDIRLSVLGPLEVSVGGRAVSVTGHMRRSILARLAIAHGSIVSTEQLIADLWDGDPPMSAKATFQTHVSQLRKQLGQEAPVVLTEESGYRLDGAIASFDLVAFESVVQQNLLVAADKPAVASEQLRTALAMWRGPPLKEFDDHDWARNQAARLSEIRFEALDACVSAELALGEHAALIAEVEHLVVQEPLREQLTAHLMLALYRCGRQAEALRAYSRLRLKLRDDLGIEPSQPLRSLEESILLQKSHLDWNPTEPAAVSNPAAGADPPNVHMLGPELTTFVDRLPFVGRQGAVAQLNDAWSHVANGRSRLLMVTGEVGVGKTRLIGEWMRNVTEAGHLVLAATAVAGLGAPFQPLVEAVAPLLDTGVADTRGMALGQAGPSTHGLDPELRRASLLAGFRDTLTTIASDRPTLLVIDDFHWADPGTCAVIERLDSQECPLLVVGVYDTSSLTTDGPIGHLLARGPDFYDAIELQGLDISEVDDLLTAYRPDHKIDPQEVWERTGGNALFLAELLREAGPIPASGGLREVVAHRLGVLSDNTRECLRVAAVIGARFRFATLAQASGSSEKEVLDALDEANDAGVLMESNDEVGRFRFTHRVVAEEIYGAIGQTRRRWLHGRVAEALELGLDDSSNPTVLASAEHFDLAGPTYAARAATAFLAGARHVGDVLDPSRALQLAERGLAALDRAEGDADTVSTRTGLILVAAQVHVVAGDFGLARRLAQEAVELARGSRDNEALALAATVLGTGSRIGTIDDEGILLSHEVLDQLAESALRARVMAGLAMQENAAGRGWQTERLTSEALAMARHHDDGNAAVLASWARGLTQLGSERVDLVAESAQFLLETGTEHDLDELVRLGLWLRSSNDLVMAERGSTEAAVAALDARIHPGTVGLEPAWRATLAMMDGRFDEAEPDISVSLEAADDPNFLAIYAGQMFWLHHERGTLAELIPLLEHTVRASPEMVAFASALALAKVTSGDHVGGRSLFAETVLAGPSAVPQDLTWPGTIANLTEVVALLGDEEAADWLCDLVAPRSGQLAVVALGTYCAGAYDRFAGMLFSELGRDADARDAFERAIKIEERVSAPALLARSRYWYAAHLYGTGSAETGRPLAAAAKEAARQMGMVQLEAAASSLLTTGSTNDGACAS